MKRIFAISALMCVAWVASAQSMYDALGYCERNYYGTARSIALGNAMTALGGDMGSIGINPAGSAVTGYSQFTFSPGLSIACTTAGYASQAYANPSSNGTANRSRFIVPNLGLSLNFNTGAKTGLTRFTFGVTSNMTNLSLDEMFVSGNNPQLSSMMGAYAFYANGTDCNMMGSDAYFNTGIPWPTIMAYRGGLISTIGGDSSYIGSSEVMDEKGNIYIPGALRQDFTRRHLGSKKDIVINVGADFSEHLYLGVNLGIVSLNYQENISQKEIPLEPTLFGMNIDGRDTYWTGALQRYYLNTDASGINAKFGFIYLPFDGLRLGGAVQTPTLMNVRERWAWDALTTFDSLPDSGEPTPEGEYCYNLISPFSFNLGAAYTMGRIALVSIDWERTAFKGMRLYEKDTVFGYDSFADTNRDISNYAGVTNAIRAGVEVKVLPELSVRTGYNRKTYACTDYTDITDAFAGGLGYSTDGSFFCDLAVRMTRYPQSWYYPYDNYIYDDYGDVAVESPEINIAKKVFDVVFTLGWRF